MDPMATPSSLESLIAPGAQVLVRDEDWLVRLVVVGECHSLVSRGTLERRA